MVTVTLDEITLNAVKAALDERIKRLHAAVKTGQRFLEDQAELGFHYEDSERMVVWNIAALHETKMAREYLSDPEVVPEHPADATFASTR